MQLKDYNNTDVKKGRLEDSGAMIYDKDRPNLSPEENWAGMSRKEKFDYYREYYLKSTLVILILVVAAAYVIFTLSRPDKKYTITVGMLEGVQFSSDVTETIVDEFCTYLEDSGYDGTIDRDHTRIKTYYATIVHQTELDNFFEQGVFDVFISVKPTYDNCVGNGIYRSLDEVLTKEELAQLEDILLYDKGIEDTTDRPYGIQVTDKSLHNFYYSGDKEIAEPVILTVVTNTHNPEAARAFIRFLFQLK